MADWLLVHPVGARRVVWLDAPMPARSGATLPSAEVRALVAPLVDVTEPTRIADLLG